MEQTFHIRTGQVSDYNFIVNAQLAMAKETEDYLLDRCTVEKGVRAVLDDATKGTYYIAQTANSQVAGMLLSIPEWSDWRNGTVLWIHSVYVVPAFRKQGVYKSLYCHLHQMVESSSHLRGLRLYVDKRNISAQQVYKKLGMTNEHYELYEWLK